MANEKKIEQKDGKYGLGGSKDTDIEGVDTSTYDVYTTDKNLDDAKKNYPSFDWFACFTIKDKSGNQIDSIAAYTIKFDKPVSGNFYYYYNGSAHQVATSDDVDKGGKKRVKVTLTVGDPPIGMG